MKTGRAGSANGPGERVLDGRRVRAVAMIRDRRTLITNISIKIKEAVMTWT